MIARVRGVIARSVASTSSVYVAGSMSTKTGVAPVIMIVVAEATNENAGVITSSPAPIPSAVKVRLSASVPDATPIAHGTPQTAASSCSSARPSPPSTNWLESSTRAVTASNSALSAACCLVKSMKGII
jgi:hypothetical protein